MAFNVTLSLSEVLPSEYTSHSSSAVLMYECDLKYLCQDGLQPGRLGCFWNAQQAEIEMIYSQLVADINIAEPFVPIQQVGPSFECSNPFKSSPTLRGNKYVQIDPLNRLHA